MTPTSDCPARASTSGRPARGAIRGTGALPRACASALLLALAGCSDRADPTAPADPLPPTGPQVAPPIAPPVTPPASPPFPLRPTPFRTVLSNFGADAAPLVRFDVGGNALDAHEGHLQHFDDTYYLYGTSYDCGFTWQERGTPFCGFKVYSSTDLVHWTDRGFLFDARTPTWQSRCDGATFGCYRPHVVHNAKTGQYVLWINGYDVGVGFHVFQSKSPVGPFVEVAAPTLAVNQGLPPGVNNGDHALFVDGDQQAYLVYTDWKRQGDLVVEELDGAYLTGSGRFTRLGLSGREGPALFQRGDHYYLTFTDHDCAACATGTAYLRASHPLGPWARPTGGGPSTISASSCGGPSAAVTAVPTTAGPAFLLQSDLWKPGDRSQALSHHFWGPLSFTSDGAIEPLRCEPSVELDLAAGKPGALEPASGVDQTTGREGFRLQCDIGARERLQTFTAGRSGPLSRIGITTFAMGSPGGDLVLQLVAIDADGLPGATLATSAVPGNRVGRSAREIAFELADVTLVAGQRYGFVLRTTLEGEGCYGFAYRDDGAYPRGEHLVSEDEGASWNVQDLRTLKFSTTMP